MTELEIHRPNNGLEQYTTGAVASLTDWADELVAAGQIATKLCTTPFVPDHFRGKPADAAAAILTGHELGLSPMASLRSIFLIKGNPGMYAKSMVAVVQAQGHSVWVVEQSDEKVVVRGQRKGSPHVYETTWDRARVVKAKLTSNSKYQENPQQMMVARGQSEICRQMASDALHGIPYSVEELEDFPDRPALNAAPKVTAAEILGTPEPTAEQAEDTLPAHPMITDAQRGKLQALRKTVGFGERAKDLAAIGHLVGREISTSNDLTKTEATFVIDKLEQRRKQMETAKPAEVDHEAIFQAEDNVIDFLEGGE